jgi:UDP-N-acetylmuramoyl-L-alanyl-D-glutamate--2,6-diaminopimelate ligase
MRFSELLSQSGLRVLRRRGDAAVEAIETDSRRCGPGCCFVAVRGWTEDGHNYIPQAVQAGAAAVVCQDPAAVPAPVASAVVADTQLAAGRMAQALRGWPARRLVGIGVTGTNGKTTVAYLLRSVLRQAGHRPALLGTVRYETGRRTVDAAVTTPDPVHLAEMTDEMVRAGMTHLVMEVSSHALDQRRTAGVDFRVGVFTNLSGDHLDYHGTMAAYRAAKRRLFEDLAPEATAVVNRDAPAGEAMAGATGARVLWYGLSNAADVRGRIERIDASGTRLTLMHGGRCVPAATALIGRHNVHNLLAAAAAGAALGLDLETIAAGVRQVRKVPGRLERVEVPAPYDVFVDYAHTDDALSNVLRALQPLCRGRIILVFGCGGDRDRTKRPRMARAAEQAAGPIVVTSDNPRTEQPGAIIEEILAGFSPAGRRRVRVEPDRRAAIEAAVEMAEAGDIVLIAGKGHETYQVLGARRVPFDDVETAGELVRRREGRP